MRPLLPAALTIPLLFASTIFAQQRPSTTAPTDDRELPVVAIIGTGNIGGALGPKLAAGGYRVVSGSRDPARETVRELVERTGPGASAATQEQAAARADAIVLAVPGEALEQVVRGLGDAVGLGPFDAGPLRFSRRIDEMSMLFFVPLQQGRAQGIEFKLLRSSYWPCTWDVAAQFGPTADRDDLAEFPRREEPRPCEQWKKP